MLTKDELEEIAAPIIEALKQINQEVGNQMAQIPQVRLVMDDEIGHIKYGDHEISQEELQQIQDYVQDYIESECSPTILH